MISDEWTIEYMIARAEGIAADYRLGLDADKVFRLSRDILRFVQEARQPALDAAEWEDAQHNDIINVNNGLQIRVVIGSGENQGTHLHIRKLQSNGWRHVYVTTLAPGWRLMRPRKQAD